MQDKILNNVNRFLRKISKNKTDGLKIAVGFSGGIDSIALLYILNQIKIKSNLISDITAIHFNHGLRGVEADNDMLFCENFCKEYNIEFVSHQLNVKRYSEESNQTIEEAARNLRYTYFKDFKENKKYDFIALGHHANDRVETVFFNFFRGSGISGLTGIRKQRDFYIRPLLDFTKKELEQFIKENNLNYVTDTSNLESDFTRNKIRNILIPSIEKELNREITSSILNLSDIMLETEEYFESLIQKIFEDINVIKVFNDFIIINEDKFLKYENVIKSYIISKCFKILEHYQNPPRKHIKEILLYIDNEKDYNFNSIVVTNSRNNIIIGREVLSSLSIEINNLNKKYIYNNFELNLTEKEKSIHRFDKDKISGNIYITDVKNCKFKEFFPFGKTSSEKLSKTLSDKKIPRYFRDILPVVCDDNGIIYVPHVGIGKQYIEDEKSQNLVYITKENSPIDKLF